MLIGVAHGACMTPCFWGVSNAWPQSTFDHARQARSAAMVPWDFLTGAAAITLPQYQVRAKEALDMVVDPNGCTPHTPADANVHEPKLCFRD